MASLTLQLSLQDTSIATDSVGHHRHLLSRGKGKAGNGFCSDFFAVLGYTLQRDFCLTLTSCQHSSQYGPEILQLTTDEMAHQLQPMGQSRILCAIASQPNSTMPSMAQSLLLTCYSGWLFGSSSKKKSKAHDLEPYQSPAERAEMLKEGRAIDLAALLELKALVQHRSVEFFKTWVEDGNPCDFAKVLYLYVASCLCTWYI